MGAFQIVAGWWGHQLGRPPWSVSSPATVVDRKEKLLSQFVSITNTGLFVATN